MQVIIPWVGAWSTKAERCDGVGKTKSRQIEREREREMVVKCEDKVERIEGENHRRMRIRGMGSTEEKRRGGARVIVRIYTH